MIAKANMKIARFQDVKMISALVQYIAEKHLRTHVQV